MRLVAVVSFGLSTRRRPIAFGLGRAVVSFLCLDHCVGFGRLRPSSVVSLVFLILDRVRCLVVPRGVGFSLSRFGLVFGCVCAVVSFYYSLRSAPSVGFSRQKVENSRCILFVFR